MIADSRKLHNQEFGKNVVLAAKDVEDKKRRDLDNTKQKNFLLAHKGSVRNWKEIKEEE